MAKVMHTRCTVRVEGSELRISAWTQSTLHVGKSRWN